MTGLEIVGASALYIVAIIVAGYVAFFLTYIIVDKISPNAGLAGLLPPVVVAAVIWIIGLIGGLLMLGALIAS
jgi:xanthine/uracil permease